MNEPVPSEISEGGTQRGEVDLARVIAFLSPALPWSVAMLVAVFVSLFEVRASTGGVSEFQVRASPITVAVLALIWLPGILRTWALGGGSAKTAVGEVSLGGLSPVLDLFRKMPVAAQQVAIPGVIAGLEAAQRDASDPALRSALARLRRELTATAPDREFTRKLVETYARDYEHVRKTRPGEAARTAELERMVAAIRGLAEAAAYSIDDLKALYASRAEGKRIAALALAQQLRDSRTLPFVLDAIENSESAFEQYHALLAAAHLARIPGDKRTEIAKVVTRALIQNVWLQEPSDRRALALNLRESSVPEVKGSHEDAIQVS